MELPKSWPKQSDMAPETDRNITSSSQALKFKIYGFEI